MQVHHIMIVAKKKRTVTTNKKTKDKKILVWDPVYLKKNERQNRIKRRLYVEQNIQQKEPVFF